MKAFQTFRPLAAFAAFALAGNCAADINYIWANTSSNFWGQTPR
jgi:hypothetical protein